MTTIIKNKTPEDFFNLLFDEGEYTNFAGLPDAPSMSMSILNWVSPGYRYFSLNPIKQGKSRSNANVAKFRNLLFETDKIDLESQQDLFNKSGLPYSTCVFSGRRSYHYIVSLDKPFEDRIKYQAVWLACQKVLNGSGLNLDPSVEKPSGLTRKPGAVNQKTEQIQTLVDVKTRRSQEELFKWLESNGVNWEDFVPKFKPADPFITVSSATAKMKLDWVLKYKMGKQEFTEGNRNLYQFVLARALKNAGVDKFEASELIKSHCGFLHDNGNSIDSAFSPKYDSDEKIYVPTLEERREFYRQKEATEKKSLKEEQKTEKENIKIQHQKAITALKMGAYDATQRPPIGEEREVENTEGIHRYITVGKDYFKIDPERNELIPWSASLFEKVYGSGMLPPKAYDNFDYEPNYLLPLKQIVDCGSRGQYRNHFQKPVYKCKEGAWPTIEQALRNAFKDQYELALKYAAIQIVYPKQKLPIIVLVGDEGVGKSGLIKIFQIMLGEGNCKTIKSKQFESDFEGHLHNIQLLIIEEAGNWKDPKAVSDEFKRLATEMGKITVNPKYGRQVEVPFYGKFMLSSNDLSPLKLEGEATRFWVLEMTKIKNSVSDYYAKIESEIGAFTWHLINVVAKDLEPPSARKERLYFKPEEYHTTAKDFLKEMSKSDLHLEIIEIFQDFFDKYDDDCAFDLVSLEEKIEMGGRFTNQQIKQSEIKAVLAKEWGIKSRLALCQREDSLTFSNTAIQSIFNIPVLPKRKSRWFILEKSKFNKENPDNGTTKD
jgi:hypothetical protein